MKKKKRKIVSDGQQEQALTNRVFMHGINRIALVVAIGIVVVILLFVTDWVWACDGIVMPKSQQEQKRELLQEQVLKEQLEQLLKNRPFVIRATMGGEEDIGKWYIGTRPNGSYGPMKRELE